jgi:hypothetical protein
MVIFVNLKIRTCVQLSIVMARSQCLSAEERMRLVRFMTNLAIRGRLRRTSTGVAIVTSSSPIIIYTRPSITHDSRSL